MIYDAIILTFLGMAIVFIILFIIYISTNISSIITNKIIYRKQNKIIEENEIVAAITMALNISKYRMKPRTIPEPTKWVLQKRYLAMTSYKRKLGYGKL